MMNVLLVEPEDDFCLFLRQAVTSAGCRTTITGSFAEAEEAMDGAGSVDFVITNAVLPDGSGIVLALSAARMGKRAVVMRKEQGSIVLSDEEATICRGDCVKIAVFLQQMLGQAPQGREYRLATNRA